MIGLNGCDLRIINVKINGAGGCPGNFPPTQSRRATLTSFVMYIFTHDKEDGQSDSGELKPPSLLFSPCLRKIMSNAPLLSFIGDFKESSDRNPILGGR